MRIFIRFMLDQYIDYSLHIKRAEITRFLAHVTDCEHREYFEMY